MASTMDRRRKGFVSGETTYKCLDCGKLTRDVSGGEGSCQLCLDCYDYSGWENTHSDNAHSESNQDDNCPICKKEFGGEAEEEVKAPAKQKRETIGSILEEELKHHGHMTYKAIKPHMHKHHGRKSSVLLGDYDDADHKGCKDSVLNAKTASGIYLALCKLEDEGKVKSSGSRKWRRWSWVTEEERQSDQKKAAAREKEMVLQKRLLEALKANGVDAAGRTGSSIYVDTEGMMKALENASSILKDMNNG